MSFLNYLFTLHLPVNDDLIYDLFSVGKSCGAPPTIQMATPSVTVGHFGDHVTYTCDYAHNQAEGGTGRHQCADSGTWVADGADSLPVCLGLYDSRPIL